MKIRSGFVSNSSSSSFCIYGTTIGIEELKKIADVLSVEYDDDSEEYDLAEEISEELTNQGYKVQAFMDGPSHDLWLGRHLPPDDDETYGDFKKSVEEIGNKLLGEEYSYSFEQDGWYDS